MSKSTTENVAAETVQTRNGKIKVQQSRIVSNSVSVYLNVCVLIRQALHLGT